jgi:hypothetical protein
MHRLLAESDVQFLSPEMRMHKDHPLRAIRAMVDDVLRALSPQFDRMYATAKTSHRLRRRSCCGRNCCRYLIRSERLLMEEHLGQRLVSLVCGTEP